jgi:hypothetical protein
VVERARVGPVRRLRSGPLGKVAIFVAVLLGAYLVSQSCGRTSPELTQAEAIAIAERHVDYEPAQVQVRLLKRGLRSREFWGVSLCEASRCVASGRITVVVVDAETGAVDEVRRQQR